jgi:hypothetical protein
MAGYRLDGRGSIPSKEQGFSPVHNLQSGSRIHPASYPMVIEGPFTGGKVAGREADYSPPSSVEIKNGGAIPPLLKTPSWHEALLIKHRNNIHSFIHSFINSSTALCWALAFSSVS